MNIEESLKFIISFEDCVSRQNLPELYEGEEIVRIRRGSMNEFGVYTSYSASKIPEFTQKTITLIDSDSKKLVINVSNLLYHSVVDSFGMMLLELEKSKEKLEIVLDVDKDDVPKLIFNYFCTFLSHKKIKFYVVDLGSSSDIVLIKNAYYLKENIRFSQQLVEMKLSAIRNSFLSNLGSYFGADKKVYITRRQDKVKKISLKEPYSDETILTSNERFSGEKFLENYLSSIGFEIVDLESKFKSYEEQIDYFSKVKIVVSPTGTGLLNAIYMPSKSLVVELSSYKPIYRKTDKELGKLIVSFETLHGHYSRVAEIANLLYFRIPSGSSSTEVVEIIKSNKMINDFFKN